MSYVWRLYVYLISFKTYEHMQQFILCPLTSFLNEKNRKYVIFINMESP